MAATTSAVSGLRPGEEKLFPGQPRGFPFGDFDVEDVMLPDGDDMGIPSEESDAEPEVQAESGFGAVIGAFLCLCVCAAAAGSGIGGHRPRPCSHALAVPCGRVKRRACRRVFVRGARATTDRRTATAAAAALALAVARPPSRSTTPHPSLPHKLSRRQPAVRAGGKV
jgi:hypothetical protein